MCAIAGIISSQQIFHDILAPVLAAMSHRGPDGSHVEHFENQGCFGHNRLAIIDLDERAAQPMWDSTHRFCISFNGEIYNYLSLRKELINAGHQFRTQSDTEVLIEAWAKWGSLSIQRLVGMFAFAIWDNAEQQLYLVRDRMGEKPLYYAPIHHNFHEGITFASELKGLMQFTFISKTISTTALSHYLHFNYTATHDAIFKDVYKLPPASYLQLDVKTGHHQIREYWSLSDCFKQKSTISFSEAQEQLDTLLKETVKIQSIADVPLGAFLSGGIDSSTIVAHMCQQHPNNVKTYSIGFLEKTYSELSQSEKTARYLKSKHHVKIVSPNIQELLPKLAYAFDEPFADTSLIPTYLLCAFARQSVTVSLSGDGGDELLGGYVTYQADRYHQGIQHLPLKLRQLLNHFSQYLPTSFAKVSWDYKLKQFLRGALLDAARAHLSWREIFTLPQQQILFRPEYRSALQESSIESSLSWFNDVSQCHYLDQAMYVDMKTWLVDDILLKVDRAAMANSLEVRAPFLDHRIVEFAAQLPIEYKIKRSTGKYILRESQKPRLPPHVLTQPKRGFNSPISHWLKIDLFDFAYDMTTSATMNQWFEIDVIKNLWHQHRQGSHDHGHRLFNLLSLATWHHTYFNH